MQILYIINNQNLFLTFVIMGNYPYCLLCNQVNQTQSFSKPSITIKHKRSSSLDAFDISQALKPVQRVSVLLEEKHRIFKISHLTFEEFEYIYKNFRDDLLHKIFREAQKMNPIEPLFSLKFYEIYERHLKLPKTELHRLHWTFDSRWRNLVQEFHYPFEVFASTSSPVLKLFKNLKLRSRILITDERIINCLNIIKEDLEDEYNRIVLLLYDLSRFFQENLSKYGKLNSPTLKNLPKEEYFKLKKWVFRVIKKLIIEPIKEIIRFLYDRIIKIIQPKLSSSNLEDQLYSLSEELIFKPRFRFFETVQNILFYENQSNRRLLRDNRFLIKEYEDLNNQNRYDISKDFKLDETCYSKCIENMKAFSKKRSSFERVKILYEIYKEIFEILKKAFPKEEEIELKGKLSAENLLPLLIYLIVKSKNSNIHQDIMFCEYFSRESLDNDYLFCIFKSGLEYVTVTE